jgi:hypothetical protein
MGWLDNSTNNIILDAVLTDYGRQAMAQASQSTINAVKFNFVKFALGDDEVNYGIIKQYGRTVGREKIEKNTPIFEGFTNQNIAQKYKLFSSAVPLLYVPRYTFTVAGNTSVNLITNGGVATSNTITVTQLPTGGSTLEPDVQESQFSVYVPSLFLIVVNSANQEPTGGTQQSTTKVYTFSDGGQNVTVSDGSSKLEFLLRTKTLPNSIFDVYGNAAGQIVTSVRVVGTKTGVSIDIPVTISKTP